MKFHYLLCATILTTSIAGAAHQDAKGSHGGQLIDIAPYHAEFTVMTGMLHIYLLAEKNKAMSAKGLAGSIIIQFPDGKKVTEKMVATGDSFMVKAPVVTDKAFVAMATFKIKDKSYTARYSHKEKKEEKKAVKSHSGAK